MTIEFDNNGKNTNDNVVNDESPSFKIPSKPLLDTKTKPLFPLLSSEKADLLSRLINEASLSASDKKTLVNPLFGDKNQIQMTKLTEKTTQYSAAAAPKPSPPNHDEPIPADPGPAKEVSRRSVRRSRRYVRGCRLAQKTDLAKLGARYRGRIENKLHLAPTSTSTSRSHYFRQKTGITVMEAAAFDWRDVFLDDEKPRAFIRNERKEWRIIPLSPEAILLMGPARKSGSVFR
jgi:integrase